MLAYILRASHLADYFCLTLSSCTCCSKSSQSVDQRDFIYAYRLVASTNFQRMHGCMAMCWQWPLSRARCSSFKIQSREPCSSWASLCTALLLWAKALLWAQMMALSFVFELSIVVPGTSHQAQACCGLWSSIIPLLHAYQHTFTITAGATVNLVHEIELPSSRFEAAQLARPLHMYSISMTYSIRQPLIVEQNIKDSIQYQSIFQCML